MTTSETLAEVKWQLRKAIRQSSLNGVNRSTFHIFICNWSRRPKGPCSICKEVRDMFREKERNAFVPSDLEAFLSSANQSPSREKLLRQATRTANLVFVIYNHHTATQQLGRPAEIALSEITPTLPTHIRNRVRPFSFCRDEKVEIPSLPGAWTTTQPQITDRETLRRRMRLVADAIRSDQTKTPGEHWYENSG